MDNVEKYYEELWKIKSKQSHQDYVKKRDFFHRYFLDHIVSPYVNGRVEVAKRLLSEGERILDIGCWGGESTVKMGVFQKFRKVYAVDLPIESVNKAKERGMKAFRVDLNKEKLPFDNNYFDTVTCLAVLTQVFDLYSLIWEIYRVLKPGGDLIISVPNIASFSNRIRILCGRRPVASLDPGYNGGVLHNFTLYDVCKFLKHSNFKVVIKKSTGGWMKLKRLWLSLLSGELVIKCVKIV